MSEKKWWQSANLKFSCKKGCTDCCKRTGMVFFGRSDIKRAATHLKMTQTAFIEEYLAEWGSSLVVLTGEPFPCPFLKKDGCGIYKARPRQCSTYPFWPEYLKHPDLWKKESDFCEGMDKGRTFPLNEIKERLKSARRNPV